MRGRDGEVEVGEHAVLRAAAWPIEAIAPFGAPALMAAVDAWIADEAATLLAGAALLDRLHAAVPRLADRRARGAVLAIKRRIHAGAGVLPILEGSTRAALRAIDRELCEALDAAAEARRALAAARLALARWHDETLADESAALAALADEPAFRRALVVANPELVAAPGAREKGARIRRREATLFHYLMRAVGRATPFGLFAGVALVAPSEAAGGSEAAAPGLALTFEVAAPRRRATVDLAPFEGILAATAADPRYVCGADLRVHPTLRTADGGWVFERAGAPARLPHHPLVAALLGPYPRGHVGPGEAVIDALLAATGGPPARATPLREVVVALVSAGVLVVDLGLARVDAAPLAALRAASLRLLEPERGRWSAAIAAIADALSAIEDGLSDMSAESLAALSAAVDREVAGLWMAAGLGEPAPRRCLRVDLALPWSIRWGAGARATVARGIAALHRFHAAEGSAELYRRATVAPWRRALAGAEEARLLDLEPRTEVTADTSAEPPLAGSLPAIFARFAGEPGLDAELDRRHERWRSWIAGAPAETPLRLDPAGLRDPCGGGDPGYGGSTLIALSGGPALWCGPARPQPGLFFGRFADLLLPRGGGGLVDELRRRFALRVPGALEVVAADPINPNAALRPSLVPRTLDLRGRGDLALADLRLALAGDGRPRLRLGELGERLVPIDNSPAALAGRDRWSWRVHTLAMAQGWEYCSFDVPLLPAEVELWHRRPRLLIADDVVLARARWVLDREQLAAIAGAAGFERTLAWRRIVGPLGVPALVHVGGDGEAPELLLRTDSPLALRCLFDTRGARAAALVLTELAGDPASWPLVDARGDHYLAELAVHWWAGRPGVG